MKKFEECLLWLITIGLFISTVIFGYLYLSEPFLSIMSNGYTDTIGAGMLLLLFPGMLVTFLEYIVHLVHYYREKNQK